MSGQSRPRILHLERIGDVFLNRLAALGARDLHDLLGYLSNARNLAQAPGVGVRGAIVDGLNVVAQAVPDMTVQVGVGLAVLPAPGTTGVVPCPAVRLFASNTRCPERSASAISTFTEPVRSRRSRRSCRSRSSCAIRE